MKNNMVSGRTTHQQKIQRYGQYSSMESRTSEQAREAFKRPVYQIVNKKNENKYSIFTKEELSMFLMENENSFLSALDPYSVLLDMKMDALMEKIRNNVKASEAFSKELARNHDIKIIDEMMKNHDAWDRLNKEYDRLHKLRFCE